MANQMPPTQRGYNFGEVSSSMQKAIRRSNEHDALYWGLELEESGYGGYVWKRLHIITSEDIGLAEPHLATTMRALSQNWEDLKKKKEKGRPEKLYIVHGLMLAARAKKSRAVDNAKIFFYNQELVTPLEIPDEALDQHTLRGYKMGRRLQHFADEGSVLVGEDPSVDDPYKETVNTFLREKFPDYPDKSYRYMEADSPAEYDRPNLGHSASTQQDLFN